MKNQHKAFTLVELIVVITILAILGTIAFLAFQGYSKTARDSRRVSDIGNIKTALELFILNTGKYPLPDNGEEVSYSGDTLWTQGTVGNNVTTNLSETLQKKPLDPLLDIEYVYSATYSQKEYQVMALYEGELSQTNNLINTSYAVNNYNIKLEGTYNEIFVKSQRFIVPTPSIINSEVNGSGITLNNTNIKSQVITGGTNFLKLNIPNIPQKIGDLDINLSIYTGSVNKNIDSTIKREIALAIQGAYSGSTLATQDIYKDILSKTTPEEFDYLVDLLVLKTVSSPPLSAQPVNIPTVFNYYTVSHPSASWITNHDNSITGDGLLQGGYTDIDLPFNINGGDGYSFAGIEIESDGIIYMADSFDVWNQELDLEVFYNGNIDGSNGGSIYYGYGIDNGVDYVVISYENITPAEEPSKTLNFQAIIYEDGRIQFNYKNMSFLGLDTDSVGSSKIGLYVNGTANTFLNAGSLSAFTSSILFMPVMKGPINGICGSADGIVTYGFPYDNACEIGNYFYGYIYPYYDNNYLVVDGNYNWQCNGLFGGNPVPCSAPTSRPICDNYTFSNWSICNINKIQTRNITTSSPSGCIVQDKLSQSCTYYNSQILGTTGNYPYSITIDSAGNIYTVNANSNNVTKITPSGVSTILGTTGNFPTGITIDSAGNIYTANNYSNNVTKITPSGVSTILGTTGNFPSSIIIDSAGNIYTANPGSLNITKITPSGVSTTLGTIGNQTQGITIDSAGNIYTTSVNGNGLTKTTPTGVSTIVGTTGNSPYGITIDSAGNIYTANNYSNNVSKITPSGVSTILGTTGNSPAGITIDSAGNIYTANTTSRNVTKITPSGESTILGTTGNDYPNYGGIVIDSSGNLYIPTNGNNVYKLSPEN